MHGFAVRQQYHAQMAIVSLSNLRPPANTSISLLFFADRIAMADSIQVSSIQTRSERFLTCSKYYIVL